MKKILLFVALMVAVTISSCQPEGFESAPINHDWEEGVDKRVIEIIENHPASYKPISIKNDGAVSSSFPEVCVLVPGTLDGMDDVGLIVYTIDTRLPYADAIISVKEMPANDYSDWAQKQGVEHFSVNARRSIAIAAKVHGLQDVKISFFDKLPSKMEYKSGFLICEAYFQITYKTYWTTPDGYRGYTEHINSFFVKYNDAGKLLSEVKLTPDITI